MMTKIGLDLDYRNRRVHVAQSLSAAFAFRELRSFAMATINKTLHSQSTCVCYSIAV